MSPQRPTLLVLAPYGETFWAPMLARLDASVDVIVDCLAHGNDFGLMARRIVAQAPARFALLGFCMGGYLAFELLRAAPERISRLALINAAARADSAPQAAMRAKRMVKLRLKSRTTSHPDSSYLDHAVPWLLSATSVGSPHKVRAVRKLLSEIPLSRSADQQQAMLGRVDSRAMLSRIAVPTVIVSGREDRIVPLLHAHELGEAIPNSSIHILERCGHLAPLEAPAELATLISRWLAREFDVWKQPSMAGESHVAAG